MSKFEIREYSGDFEDVIELTRRVWMSEYRGKTWFPLPDAAFMRDRYAPELGAICLVAYEGPQLAGSLCLVPRTMRVDGVDYPIMMSTSFSVEPASRRVALPLIARLRRLSEEKGAAFGVGIALDDPATPSYRFWTKYAESYPQYFRFLFDGTYLAKVLRPEVVARAGIKSWERVLSRALAPLLRFVPYGSSAAVRFYKPSDLERCAELVEKSYADVDWAMRWSLDQLSARLGRSAEKTFVYERDGVVQAFVNWHVFPLQGREAIQCAVLEMWSEDEISHSARARFISHLCRHLRDVGVDTLVVPRTATTPTAALLTNLFIPSSDRFRIGVFPTKSSPPLASPKSWSFDIM